MNKEKQIHPQIFSEKTPYTPPIRIELPTIFGMKTVNSYLYTNPEPTLIDCGENSKASWEALQKGLADNGLKVSDIKKVIVTHAHIDHIGMAGKVCEHSEAEVWVSEYTYDWAVNLDKMRDARLHIISETLKELGDSPVNEVFKKVFSQFANFWLPIPPHRVKTFPVDGKLQFGGQAWEVIHAPGHCFDQVCFYQAQSKQLFSADMLLKITPTPVIDSDREQPNTRNKSIVQLLESYQKISELDIDIVYPGHFTPFDNPQTIIEYQVNRIEERTVECLKWIKEGVSDFFGLLQKMYGTNFSLPTIPMLVGYLDLLLAKNSIFVLKTDKGLRYYPV